MSRLLIYFTGSPRVQQWRLAIAEHAAARGWVVAEDDGAPDLAQRLDGGAPVLVMSSLTMPSHLPDAGFATIVVHDTPGAAMAALAADASVHQMADAAYQGAALFALAADMIHSGAVALDANASVLTLPDLGQVAGPPATRPPPPDPWRSLQIYETLPPPVGARAHWPLDAFIFPIMTPEGPVQGGRPAIDLTGRVRTLVYGPYTHLSTGLWEVEVKSVIDPLGGTVNLCFEWGTNPDYAAAVVEVSRSGVYGVRLQRFWPCAAPSEMRITTRQPHFDGRFELLSVDVKRLAHAPPEAEPALD